MKKMILILKVRMIMSCACGHDGHTTALMLLLKGVKALYDKSELPHNVVFIFQPAEETGGGANRLIKAGAFDKNYPIEAVFGFTLIRLKKKVKVCRDEEICKVPLNIASF